MRTVEIKVGTETWCVPFGFGAEYSDRASDPADAETLSDLLLMVDCDVSPETVKTWTLRQRVEAEVYAVREHLSAADNPVQRHPKPEHVNRALARKATP